MEFRYATINDINKMNELFYELDTDAIETQPEHFQRSGRTDEYFYGIINDIKSDFLLLIVEDKIIGFSLCIEKKLKD
ncbi:hypothetical protein K7I13_13925 [Brucepastera parasyntrophica]|uniref:hypothetical protein n=1 Tax=Brucepastera parasyntrophica TaxID=2880008 RepID=UPI00210932B8|nr:hypothetical protein [Brucepastera parasyntrophica]ULQ59545.1 hypothetical protein K7I13_13925 [Brucepastera parasyntrophica]